MTKVFLSTGFSDRNEKEIRERFADMMRAWRMAFPDDEFEFVDNYSEPGPKGASRTWYLGRAIQKLGDCDVIFMDHDWSLHDGCCVECDVAKRYGIVIYEWRDVYNKYVEMNNQKFGWWIGIDLDL